MDDFTPLASTVGGVLIGLASIGLMMLSGRIAGISGIAGGLLGAQNDEKPWRAAFVGGLVVGGVLMSALRPDWFVFGITRSTPLVIAAGLLVGFGTRLGNGCTSGHGVCGISRFSTRSLIATITFIAAGAATVFVLRTLGVS